MPTLVLLCGLPGAGKTTEARRREQSLPAARLCPDEWMAACGADLLDGALRDRLEVIHWNLAQSLLGVGANVVLESGSWLRSDRDRKRLGARRLGARVELQLLDVSLEERWRRLRRRNARLERGHIPLSRGDLERMEPMFERPSAEERALFDSRAIE